MLRVEPSLYERAITTNNISKPLLDVNAVFELDYSRVRHWRKISCFIDDI